MEFNIVNKKIEQLVNKRVATSSPIKEIDFPSTQDLYLTTNTIDTKQLLEKINQSIIFNHPKKQVINIKYENFTFLDKQKLKIKDWVNQRKTLTAQYNDNNKLVSIKEELLDNKHGRFKQIEDKKFLLNFVILHEVGHAMYCSLTANDTPIKLNPTLLKLVEIEGNYPAYIRKLPTIIMENFADIYATTALLVLSGQNAQLLNNLNKIYEDRKANIQEEYYSFNSIKELLTNNHTLKNLASLRDIVHCAENLTKVEIKKHIVEQLNISKGDIHCLTALGYFSDIFTPTALNDKEIRAYLYSNLDIVVPNVQFEKIYFFEYEKQQVNNKKNNKLKSKIFSIRNEKSNHTLRPIVS